MNKEQNDNKLNAQFSSENRKFQELQRENESLRQQIQQNETLVQTSMVAGTYDPLSNLHASMQILSNNAALQTGVFHDARLQEDEDLNNQIRMQIEQAKKRQRDAQGTLE